MFELTGARWRELETVQREVNARVGYRTDLSLYGVEELWTMAARQGDCEDFALAKRQALLALDWPLSALRLAVCTTRSGEGHAVLTVDTDRGVYVLDNRRPFVEPWAALPYIWIKRQAAGGSGWVLIAA